MTGSAPSGRCPSCGQTFPRPSGYCPADGTRIVPLAPEAGPSLEGRVLDGRFEIRAPLATGRIGTTYRGFQASVARDVAIKIVHPSYAADAAAAERLLNVARQTCQLVAPAIANVYDLGRTEDGLVYVVGELARGQPLSAIAAQRIAARRAVAIVLQLCDALDAAHRARAIHGDLKPSNVIVDDASRDAVKLLDLGLARALDPTLAQPDPRRAPPVYAAPEVFETGASARSDLYSLGCVLHELLVGAPPFVAASAEALAARHRREPPPELPANLPAALSSIVRRLLAKAPTDRYASCRELRTALEPALAAVGGPASAASSLGAMPAPSGAYPRDPTTPPTGRSYYPPRDPTTPPTGPSYYPPRDPTTPPTGPSYYPPRDPTTPPTGPSFYPQPTGPSYYPPRDPTTPPTGPSAYPPQPAAPIPPQAIASPPSSSRRLLVIILVALLTSAAAIGAYVALA